MNYLTEFYKNKAKQLQEKINKLETKLSIYEGDTMQVAGMADETATYVPPFKVAGDAGKSALEGVPNIPAPPPGAPPLWIQRWNYLFQNWNNPNTWQGSGSNSSPGAYLGWLLSQWGNPNFGTWS